MSKEHKKKITLWSMIPDSLGEGIVMMLMLFLESVLIFELIMLNLLPEMYLAAGIAILLGLDALAIGFMKSHKHRWKRIVGIILSCFMMVMFILGAYYIYCTSDALTKVEDTKQVEKYHVIVLKDGSYDSIEDITGENVYVVDNNSKMYEEAEQKLITAADVEFTAECDVFAAGNKLVGDDGMTQDNIIFIGEGRRSILKEEIKGFGKKTKIIYTIEIPVKSNNNASNIDVTEDSFTVYISGSDSREDITHVARSDVNMLMTINPQTHTILLTSIPRDAYVPLHMNGQMDKLTHTGIYGIEESIGTIEEWMDIEIDFYVRVGFDMVKELVDAVGGIDVYSNQDFKSAITIWEYKKGWNHCNGKKALAFARERKAFKAEDQQRIKNQQKVVKALIKKMTSSKELMTSYPQILNAIENDMQTDFSNTNVSKLAKMQLKDMPEWKIVNQSVKGKMGQEGTWSMGPGRPLDVCIIDEQSLEDAKAKIQEIKFPIEK